MFEIILAVMLNGPVWRGDAHEAPEERRELYATTAKAIAIAAGETDNPLRAAAVLIALGRNESFWSRYVLEGRCMDGPPKMRCDYSERQKRPLAIGPFQVHDWCREAWEAAQGSFESVLGSARCALQVINRGLKRCLRTPHDPWAGAFATYRGQNCSDATKIGSNYKATKYRRSMVRAEQELRSQREKESRTFLEFLRSQYRLSEVAEHPEQSASRL